MKSSKDKDGNETGVVEEIEKSDEDLDSVFREVVQRAMKPVEVVEVHSVRDPDDQNRTFRTRLVSIWLLTNGALIIAIS